MTKFKALAAYDREYARSRAASSKYNKARELYRAGKIHDAAFLAEQLEHSRAMQAFDKAKEDLDAVLVHEEAL